MPNPTVPHPTVPHPTDAAADAERGSAALEFILVGLLLLVPIVYLIVSLGMIQEQSLGAESGARHIARAVATAPDADTARARAEAVLQSITREYGMAPGTVGLSISCGGGGDCPRAGATMVVTVRTRVTLPLVPPVLGLDRMASIPVEASAPQRVSQYWGTP
ncbi:TadE/TadG family type IV pilus assembly protein [Microbacterium luticocti]|uniref:TadE/TadG family type IV pilus assembly protein n=1 Tax=Microbacterium luticocti TaxID=451764 RepID=UPI001FE10D1C|nr:TadE family protein [Microbacterium luticocti]